MSHPTLTNAEKDQLGRRFILVSDELARIESDRDIPHVKTSREEELLEELHWIEHRLGLDALTYRMTKSKAYVLAAAMFALGFVAAILASPYIPGPGSHYRRASGSLKVENRLLKQTVKLQQEQLDQLSAVVEKGSVK